MSYTWEHAHAFTDEMREPESPDAADEDENQRRNEVRKELRVVVRDKLAESTGNPDIGMSWSVKHFMARIVHREARLVEGWPPHIMFGDPGSIPGGVKALKTLLDGWKSGTIRFVKASAEDLRRARRDRQSALPSTPVPQRPSIPEKRRAASTRGQLVMEPARLDIVGRPSAVGDGGPLLTKRLRMTAGQRSDNNTVRAHRRSAHPRGLKRGVKTPRNVLDDDASPTGMVVLDDDLARLFEEGAVEM